MDLLTGEGDFVAGPELFAALCFHGAVDFGLAVVNPDFGFAARAGQAEGFQHFEEFEVFFAVEGEFGHGQEELSNGDLNNGLVSNKVIGVIGSLGSLGSVS